MFDFLRWTTLHPAVVHLPLGVLPLLFVAYLVAASTRSQRWMFAGDVVLGFAVVAVALAAGLGFVAYFALDWPGGLGPWPTAHLVLGCVTTLGVWLLGALRWRSRRKAQDGERGPASGDTNMRWAIGALAVFALATATGYIGGEILVYHDGVAVRAAADGALAPALAPSDEAPSSLMDAMHRLRALWGSSLGLAASAAVQRPRTRDFEQIADNSRRMRRLARWLVDWGDESRKRASEHEHPELGPADRSELRRMAAAFEERVAAIERAAQRHDPSATLQALGTASSSCAECHEHERWEHAAGSQASASRDRD